MPLISLEVELGPSQYEFTFAPQTGLAAADTMALFRSAMKQAARRHGYLVSFMCRPKLPNSFASGWHLHHRCSIANRERTFLSPATRTSCCRRSAGTISRASSRMRGRRRLTTPTVNGYKRYHGVNSMAPIQAVWARDNRGVMIRALGEPGDPSTHLENCVGEPLANPYLYMTSQIHAGLDGISQKLMPGPSADAPYEISAEPLPKSLARRSRRSTAAPVSAPASATFSWTTTFASSRPRSRVARRIERTIRRCIGCHRWEHREYFDLA